MTANQTNPNILKILISCIIEVSFYNHHTNIYLQHDGIVMKSALGPANNNFFSVHVENRIFQLYRKEPKFINVMWMISSLSIEQMINASQAS